MMIRVICNLILFHLPLLVYSIDFDPGDYEAYGPTLAANDQLIVAIQNRTGVTFTLISNYSAPTPTYCTATYTPSNGLEVYATMVAVGWNGLAVNNTNKFVFITYPTNGSNISLVVGIVNFPACVSTFTATFIVNGNYSKYSVLGVDATGLLAFYITDANMYIINVVSIHPMTVVTQPLSAALSNSVLLPQAIDLRIGWGVFAVYMYSTAQPSTGSSKYKPTVYRINFANCYQNVTSLCTTLTSSWQTNYAYTWQSSKAPASDVMNNDYNSLYDMSVSISDQGYLLVGIQSMDTTFCLNVNTTKFSSYGSRLPSTVPSIGFGRGVGWLDNTTAAILLNNFTLDYAQWRSSNIELYPIIGAKSLLSNTIPAFASFPNAHQQLWSQLNTRLINILAIPKTGSLILMDYVGSVYVIRPSNAGSFAYTDDGLGSANNISVAPTLRCPSGTSKNQTASGKYIFIYCVLCPEGSFYSANQSNQTSQCTPCDSDLYFCPWGAVAELPVSVLDIVSQVQVYPQSPESDVFEDVLILNMFSLDFSPQCIAKQPFFYAIIIIGIGCLFLLFMGILKLSGKLKKQRRMLKNIFKQTDLIGEGELWIGGVVSFAIVVISIFAYRFSKEFLYEYPIESAGDATFACDPTLRNAKFSTSMQSLGVPILEDEQPLFEMLDSQPFTLTIAFISTNFLASDLTVSQVLGSILLNVSYTTEHTNGILYVSTNLTSHSTTIQFSVSSNAAVGGLRVGLTGPAAEKDNYVVQELNFSYAFNHTNRTVGQDPSINVQLIKLVNETEPLSSDGTIQYSALWIPTFIKDDNQIFYTQADFQLYHVNDATIFTVQISEATYYIYNKQEPIAKVTEIIFTDILFTTMCIELFALTFLFFKLAVWPIIKALIGLCIKPKKVAPKAGVGCPYCRSVDPESLPAYHVPVQRAEQDTPRYTIRRQNWY